MRARDDSIDFFPDGCIAPKSGSPAPNGYVTFNVGQGESRLTQSGHRLAYRLFLGSIPEKAMVMHSCNNKWCINPQHLFLGMATDGGNKSALKTRGEKNYQSVLTEEIVRSILTSDEKNSVLAVKHGVTRQCIKSVRDRKSWKHITINEK